MITSTVTNIATVASDTYDRNIVNNTAILITPIESGPVADLAITKTVSLSPAKLGTPLTYILTIINNGPDQATGIVVTDILPGQVTLISASVSQGSCNHTDSKITCTLGNLANGATATVTIQVIPTCIGNITNTAVVGGNEFDPNQTNNTDSLSSRITDSVCVIVPKIYSSCQIRHCFRDIEILLPQAHLSVDNVSFKRGLLFNEVITPLPNRLGFARTKFDVVIPYEIILRRPNGSTLTANGNLPSFSNDVIHYYPKTRSELVFQLLITSHSELLSPPIITFDRLTMSIGACILNHVTLPVQLLLPSSGNQDQIDAYKEEMEKQELAEAQDIIDNGQFAD